jgi:predicted lipid carrier protein YhbT
MSKTISLSLPHNLTQDEARSRIQKAIADARRTHGAKLSSVEEKWTGNHLDFRLTAMGQTVSGRMDVQAKDVKLEVDLPMILAMFAGRFQKQVEAEGRKLLD